MPDVAFGWPDPYFDIPLADREQRVWGDANVCSIDGADFFIRGVILIPIVGTADSLGLGVWVSQKQENFETYLQNYDTAEIGPFFGWLANQIPFYEPTTLLLKTMAHFRGRGQRPLIHVEPSDHPLSVDCSRGVSLERAWAIAHAPRAQMLGGDDHP